MRDVTCMTAIEGSSRRMMRELFLGAQETTGCMVRQERTGRDLG